MFANSFQVSRPSVAGALSPVSQLLGVSGDVWTRFPWFRQGPASSCRGHWPGPLDRGPVTPFMLTHYKLLQWPVDISIHPQPRLHVQGSTQVLKQIYRGFNMM